MDFHHPGVNGETFKQQLSSLTSPKILLQPSKLASRLSIAIRLMIREVRQYLLYKVKEVNFRIEGVVLVVERTPAMTLVEAYLEVDRRLPVTIARRRDIERVSVASLRQTRGRE